MMVMVMKQQREQEKEPQQKKKGEHAVEPQRTGMGRSAMLHHPLLQPLLRHRALVHAQRRSHWPAAPTRQPARALSLLQ